MRKTILLLASIALLSSCTKIAPIEPAGTADSVNSRAKIMQTQNFVCNLTEYSDRAWNPKPTIWTDYLPNYTWSQMFIYQTANNTSYWNGWTNIVRTCRCVAR